MLLTENRKFQVGIFFSTLRGKTKIKITTTKPTQNPFRLPVKIKAARTATVVFNPQPASNRFSPPLLVLLELIPFSCQSGYPLLKKQALFALGSVQGKQHPSRSFIIQSKLMTYYHNLEMKMKYHLVKSCGTPLSL